MGSMLLWSPWVQLDFLHLALLLILSFWPGKAPPRYGKGDRGPHAHGPRAGQPPCHRTDGVKPADQSSGADKGREPLPAGGLEDQLVTEYAARFSGALERIRSGDRG